MSRFLDTGLVCLLGMATGGCQSCCHNTVEPQTTVVVTDEQIARGFPYPRGYSAAR